MSVKVMSFILGLMACLIIGVLALMLLYVLIGALIETIRDDCIEYNNRMFHGRPKAKCYCGDCKHFNTDTHLCSKHGYDRYSVDYFCRDAEPVSYKKGGIQNENRRL